MADIDKGSGKKTDPEDLIFSIGPVVVSPMPVSILKREIVESDGTIKQEFESKWEKDIKGSKIEIIADKDKGVPYGTDILVILWLIAEARKREGRIIDLKNFDSYFDLYEIKQDGRSMARLKEKLERILKATFFYSKVEKKDGVERTKVERMAIIDKWDLRFLPAEKESPPRFKDQYIVLDEAFFLSIMKNRIPYNLTTVRALKASPYDLFLYFYLSFQTFIVYEHFGGEFYVNYWGKGGLKERVGTELSRTHFRQRINESMERIRKVWEDCPVAVAESKNGLDIKINSLDQLDVKIDPLKYAGKKIREQKRTLSDRQVNILYNHAPVSIYNEYQKDGATKNIMEWLNKSMEEWRRKNKRREEKSKLTPKINEMEKRIKDLFSALSNQRGISIEKVQKIRLDINFLENTVKGLKAKRKEELDNPPKKEES